MQTSIFLSDFTNFNLPIFLRLNCLLSKNKFSFHPWKILSKIWFAKALVNTILHSADATRNVFTIAPRTCVTVTWCIYALTIQFSLSPSIEFSQAIKFGEVFLSLYLWDSWINLCCLSAFFLLLLPWISNFSPLLFELCRGGFRPIKHKEFRFYTKIMKIFIAKMNLALFGVTFYETCIICCDKFITHIKRWFFSWNLLYYASEQMEVFMVSNRFVEATWIFYSDINCHSKC